MPNIVFLEVDPEDRGPIAAKFPDAKIFKEPFGKETEETCGKAEIISAFIYSPFDRAALKKLPKLKLLCTRSVGFDHIDLAACLERGIVVCNVPDYGSHVIAEHVFALLLSTLRHINEADDRVEEGRFDYHGLRGVTLRGKTIGIVGTGKIGRRVAQIAQGFGMRIIATDRCRTIELEDLLGVRYVPFETLVSQSDIISLHLPANPSTEHMIDEGVIAKMKDGVILVNTARGSLIDSAALLKALDSGKVSYALLDVLEQEKDFEGNKELIGQKNVVTTPHIAFYADDSMAAMYLDCFDSIDQWMAGKKPEHEVKPPQVVCDLPEIRVK